MKVSPRKNRLSNASGGVYVSMSNCSHLPLFPSKVQTGGLTWEEVISMLFNSRGITQEINFKSLFK